MSNTVTPKPVDLANQLFLSRDVIKEQLITEAAKTGILNKIIVWIKVNLGITKIETLSEKLLAVANAAIAVKPIAVKNGNEKVQNEADYALNEFYRVFKERCSVIDKEGKQTSECIKAIKNCFNDPEACGVKPFKDNFVSTFDRQRLDDLSNAFTKMNFFGLINDFANKDSSALTKEGYDALITTLSKISSETKSKIQEHVSCALSISNKGHIENLEKLAKNHTAVDWNAATDTVKGFSAEIKKELEEKKKTMAEKINALRGVVENSKANAMGLKELTSHDGSTSNGLIKKAFDNQTSARTVYESALQVFSNEYKKVFGKDIDKSDLLGVLKLVASKEQKEEWKTVKELAANALEAFTALEKAEEDYVNLKAELEKYIPADGWNIHEPVKGPFMDVINGLKEEELQKAALEKGNKLAESYTFVKTLIEIQKNGSILTQ